MPTPRCTFISLVFVSVAHPPTLMERKSQADRMLCLVAHIVLLLVYDVNSLSQRGTRV